MSPGAERPMIVRVFGLAQGIGQNGVTAAPRLLWAACSSDAHRNLLAQETSYRAAIVASTRHCCNARWLLIVILTVTVTFFLASDCGLRLMAAAWKSDHHRFGRPIGFAHPSLDKTDLPVNTKSSKEKGKGDSTKSIFGAPYTVN